jgi:hypothetical protein
MSPIEIQMGRSGDGERGRRERKDTEMARHGDTKWKMGKIEDFRLQISNCRLNKETVRSFCARGRE